MATGDHPFPMLAWSGVTHPYQGIQQWRMYGPTGAGTENTGWRNYGAVGYNTSSGTGTRQAWFREGSPVQRSQYQGPRAGVQQRFTGDAIRPNTPPPIAGDLQNAISGIKQGRETNRRMQAAQARKEERDAAIQMKADLAQSSRLMAINKNLSTFTPPTQSSPIKGSPAELSWRLRAAFPQAYEPKPQTPASPEPFVPTPQQQKAIEGVAAMRAQRAKSPAAETPSTSRLSKRQQQKARADAAFTSLKEGGIGVWSDRT